MYTTILGTCLLSTFATLVLAASPPPATLEETPITKEWCDPVDVSNPLQYISPVVNTKTGGAVCHAVVGAANAVLGRDPTLNEYKLVVPFESKETSNAAWTKAWKDWAYGSQQRSRALIHAAYRGPFGRDASEAEIDYWTAKKGGYREIFDGNVTWVMSAAGENERARIIDQAYRLAAFERAPSAAEVTYWMAQYGKVDAPAACGDGKLDRFDELRCANDEWFWSAASVAERSRVVQAAGMLMCFGPKGTFDIPGSKGTFEPPTELVDAWVKRILEDRLSLTTLAQSEKFAEKAGTFCNHTAKTLTPTKLVR